MKCPYRKITTQTVKYKDYIPEPVTVEEFGECYGTECPFYYEETAIGDMGIVIPAHCRKPFAESLITRQINEREGT